MEQHNAGGRVLIEATKENNTLEGFGEEAVKQYWPNSRNKKKESMFLF